MRGVDDHDDQPDPKDPTILFVEGDAKIVPLHRGRKRPDYTHPPAGRWLWALLVPFLLAEVAALKLNVEWTLSRTVWWVLGPAYEPRWWLLGLPLFALLAWTGPHFLWPHVFGPVQLAVAVGVALTVAGVGTVLTLH